MLLEELEETNVKSLQEDWTVIEKILPAGWQAKAKELRTLFIAKAFKDAQTLLRGMLMHLSEGISLRETALRARASASALTPTCYFTRRRCAGTHESEKYTAGSGVRARLEWSGAIARSGNRSGWRMAVMDTR